MRITISNALVAALGASLFIYAYLGFWGMLFGVGVDKNGCYSMPLGAQNYPPFSALTTNGCLPLYYAADLAGVLMVAGVLIFIIGLRQGVEVEV